MSTSPPPSWLSSALSNFMKDLNENINKIGKNHFEVDLSDPVQPANIQKQLKKNAMMLAFVLLSTFFIAYVSSDPEALTKKTYTYALIIAAPLFFGLYISSQFLSGTEGSATINTLLMSVGLIAVIFLVYMYSTASTSTLVLLNYAISILVFIMIIAGLAIFYFVFSNTLKKQTGSLGYMINLVFYIPCLFADFVNYIKGQMGITPNIVYVLFMLEILLFAIYNIIPLLTKAIIRNNTSLIMNEPMFLNSEFTLASGDFFSLQNNVNAANKSIFDFTNTDQAPGIFASMKESFLNVLRQTAFYLNLRVPLPQPLPLVNSQSKTQRIYRNSNYAVSFWVFVNPGSPSNSGYTQPSNIFDYAGGKPKVSYVSDGLTHKDKYIVSFTNNPDAKKGIHEISLPNQKWHYFAFNYFDSRADLFVNGHLERSFDFNTPGSIPLDGKDTDNITVGGFTGLSGAICNVNYYKEPLPETQIANNYNLLVFSNPPVLADAKVQR